MIMSKTTLPGRLLRDERGATAIEYGLILAMITLAIIGALRGFANEATAMWDDVRSKSEEAIAAT
jgi:pilus assembly protein Flp/PilA